mgnify:CR=1 FL=1
MNEQVSKKQSQRMIRYAAFGIALIIALTGILNSMPTYGIIPPFGPFPAVVLRPLFVGAAVFLVLADSSFTSAFAQKWPDFKWLGRVVDVALLLLAWCCLLYPFPSPRDRTNSRMPSSA